ncbi:HAD-IA family hydrolase [Candidatus Woesearchaeota archaeon]|nr:HAD-IA family hydrolase [Candidatus Woesearchaeota archaeon]
MVYVFKAKGHRNILATHTKTLEFTKDPELSVDGDCIVGVSADFSATELKGLIAQHGRLVMDISAGGVSDSVEFVANKDFSSDHELVIRLSEFGSDRTLGFRCSKTAAQLDRNLVGQMQKPGNLITVAVRPKVKAVIFDFDDTIVDISPALDEAHKAVANELFETHGLYEPSSIKMLDEIDRQFCTAGVGGKPSMFDRHAWFAEFGKQAGIAFTPEYIEKLVSLYWETVSSKSRLMPQAVQVINGLKKAFKVAVISDSDGDIRIKRMRIEKAGLAGLFDRIIVSDDIGVNKPSRKFYDLISESLGVALDECVMVGDKPQVDLELAAQLGMKTVWVKRGRWARSQGDSFFHYVTHEITELKQLSEVMRQL